MTFYDRTKEDSRPWRTDQDTRAGAIDEAAQDNADAIQERTEESVPLSSIAVSPASPELALGDTQQMSVTTTPAGFEGDIHWSSLNPAVASCDQNGLVTGIGIGTAEIQAKYSFGAIVGKTTVTVSEDGGEDE